MVCRPFERGHGCEKSWGAGGITRSERYPTFKCQPTSQVPKIVVRCTSWFRGFHLDRQVPDFADFGWPEQSATQTGSLWPLEQPFRGPDFEITFGEDVCQSFSLFGGVPGGVPGLQGGITGPRVDSPVMQKGTMLAHHPVARGIQVPPAIPF